MAGNDHINVAGLFPNISDIGNNYLPLLYAYMLLDQYANPADTTSDHAVYRDRAHRAYRRLDPAHRAPPWARTSS